MVGGILLTNKESVGTNVGTESPTNNKAPKNGALSSISGGESGIIRRYAPHPFGASVAPLRCSFACCAGSVERGFSPRARLIKQKAQLCWAFCFIGGESGIRTLGTVARTTDFESVPFDHSGNSPKSARIIAVWLWLRKALTEGYTEALGDFFVGFDNAT